MGLEPQATRDIVCILNGTAGSDAARDARQKLTRLFSQHGARARIALAETGDSLPALTNQALKDGASIVVAAGGDGTVNCVASMLVNRNAALGVLPLGTLNHFSKDLGIPLPLEEAVANLLHGSAIRVDVGEVNGRIFLNNSSIGLYPAIVREREDGQKRGYGKWLALALATVYALRRYSHLYVTLQPKGQPRIEDETPFVFVGNNEYQVCGLHIGERACLNAGRLWVYRAPRASRLALFRLALHALSGRHDLGELKMLDVEEFEIHTQKRRIHVSRDGEVDTFSGPLKYRVIPGALKVIVPVATSMPPEK